MKASAAKPQAGRTAALKTHEKTDISVAGVVAFLVIMVFTAIVMHAGLWAWLKSMKGPPALDVDARSESHRRKSQIGGTYPRLQIAPEMDWQSYRKQQEGVLNEYAWVNRTSGVVRIPIEMAILRVLANGLPKWAGSNANQSPLELQRARAGTEGRSTK
jgi:hypothetical protein